MTNKHAKNTRLLRCATYCCLLILCGNAAGSDLDDGMGIDKPIDDSIKPSQNINYIVTKAKSKAKTSMTGSGARVVKAGMGNINIGAGTNLKGATIINLSTNKGNNVVAK
ncbi:hypothetical protein MNBD_GAMMA16-161 [hydrothermal vent metagenome]|uniref:Uncharacterized protein n=1 Tax=hydrothermal vent metagenome TaxID=652676 RepID=A0A3B0YWV9_9ZZZZ